MFTCQFSLLQYYSIVQKVNFPPELSTFAAGADQGGGCRGCAPPPPRDDLRFSNTTGILRKKTIWFIGVEVEQETSAPPPNKNPGSAPVLKHVCRM